jgi:hypothetical protein
MESREKTTEEIREEFLKHVRSLINYWDKVEGKDSPKTQKDRLDGLAFSIMVALDGGAMALPGFIVAPCPHPSDKEYHISEGSDYYPENHELDIKGDIAGSLHELL